MTHACMYRIQILLGDVDDDHNYDALMSEAEGVDNDEEEYDQDFDEEDEVEDYFEELSEEADDVLFTEGMNDGDDIHRAEGSSMNPPDVQNREPVVHDSSEQARESSQLSSAQSGLSGLGRA